jgi:DNA-binding MarR family transcriptional regulator
MTPAAAAMDAGIGSSASSSADLPSPDEVTGPLFLALTRLTRLMRREAPVALSAGSITALATVVADGPMRVGDLAAADGVRAPTMTRIVDSLVAEGYAERIPDPADRRACLVRATPAGVEVLTGARAARARVLAGRLSRLTPEQRAALVAAVPAIEALCADDAPTA